MPDVTVRHPVLVFFRPETTCPRPRAKPYHSHTHKTDAAAGVPGHMHWQVCPHSNFYAAHPYTLTEIL